MIELYINNNLIDITQDNLRGFSVTHKITDIESITGRSGSYSKTVTAPLTKRNRVNLGFTDEINSAINNSQLVARVEEDSVTILEGVAIIEKTIRGEAVEITIIGNNATWQDIISKRNVSEIDLTEFNHTYNLTNANASETAGLPYVYDLADRGLPYFATYWDSISIYDRFPALKVSYLFEKIFKQAGYKLNSAFFLTNEWLKKYMPFTGERLRNSDAFRIQKRARATRDTSDYTLTGLGIFDGKLPFNNAANSGSAVEPYSGYPNSTLYFDETNNWYKLPFDMVTKIRIGIKLDWTYLGSGISDIFLLYIINEKASGVDGTPFRGEILAQKQYTKVEGASEWFYLETDFCHLGKDSKVYVLINQGVSLRTLGVSQFKKDSFIQNEIDVQLCDGQPLEFNENMPNISQIDFVSGLKHDFNLHFETDVINRIITIEPRDDIYSSDYEDWSELLDLSKDITIEELGKDYTKTIRLGYPVSSNDGFLQSVNSGQITPYMAKDININHYGAKEGITEMLNPVFSATYMDYASRYGLFLTKIPKIWKENNGAIPDRITDIGFKLWHYEGVETLPDGDIVRILLYNAAEYSLTIATRTDYPKFFSYDISELNENSLAFSDNLNCIGLYEKYYRNIFNIINSGKKVEAYFNLNKLHINRLSLTKLVLVTINGEPTIFYKDEVSEYQSGQSTMVRLVTWLSSKKIEVPVKGSAFDGDLPAAPHIRSAMGSISVGLIDGVYTVRIAEAGGFRTVLTAERGVVDSGLNEAVTEISGVIYPAYTIDNDTYKKAVTQK